MNIVNVTQNNVQCTNNINFNGSITNFFKRMNILKNSVEKQPFILKK